ncbi:hypothetical protein OIU76_006770 [Salix suchowensis]|nr:hypothetical protein OIU76_006770 [Salix suchowensis]
MSFWCLTCGGLFYFLASEFFNMFSPALPRGVYRAGDGHIQRAKGWNEMEDVDKNRKQRFYLWILLALYSGSLSHRYRVPCIPGTSHNVPVLMKKSKMNKFYGTISMIGAVRCFQEAGIGKQLAGSFG